jgi:protein-S-isoprenylcysteine O-methyltransferase Ste14
VTIERVLDSLPLLSLLAAGCVALPMAIRMRARGTSVIAVDRQRTVGQLAVDVLLFWLLLVWFYLVVATSGWLSVGLLPKWLTVKVVDGPLAHVIGTLLLLSWPLIYAASVRTLGDAWRLGIDREGDAQLVTRGIYSWSRNPIYLAFNMHFWGTVLVAGRVVHVVLAVVLSLLLHVVVLREERFLADRCGDAFARYRAQVARYLSLRH